MKYVMCPECGRRLCKGEIGTRVEIECSKCGKNTFVIIEEDCIHITYKSTSQKKDNRQAG